ncbi:toll/interleukin-1 receptor domain-containing protein [Mucilaginibacter rubeus]|uniref:TIR domain-containing protein n=1 Tax=Mucilaginibacter rubeus TaxID=2027860 RepID=A0A5C1I5M2_9SPHI|nr:toll/interleukin-1 receptor domain-containing protein [Mucilaginibacter rubeus]QEM13407.1 hypothetical protein DEO27_026485 [Mucilaginibacter rubeus]
MKENIPLNILIIDAETDTVELLKNRLQLNKDVLKTYVSTSIKNAKIELNSKHINVVFIDPLSFDLDEASKFIFNVRGTLPEIVFVLFYNYFKAEQRSSEFYRGQRSRFTHYYKLNKQTPIENFQDEMVYIFQKIQSDLRWRMSDQNIKTLIQQSEDLINKNPNSESEIPKVLEELRDQLDQLRRQTTPKAETVTKKSIFISYRFTEIEYKKDLADHLIENGYSVVTGMESNQYISDAIIARIKQCEFFLCLMTKHQEKKDGTFTTSPWLLEEKGVALASNKKLVLLIEEGVTDYGGLQGDWQRIHFSSKGFMSAAKQALKQIKSFEGEN